MLELNMLPLPDVGNAPLKWGKVLNQDTCIGCHACSTACKSEHLVPLGVNRTYVKQVEVGTFPEVSRQFQVTRCNQCEDAPCVEICPVTAMYKRSDGIVDFDPEVCIGCKACIAACPYDAIHISPESHSAEKCNFCAHRIDQGLEPACVAVCPVGAIVVGDLNDPESEVSLLVSRNKVDVRKPEKGTDPKVFYVGASDYTLSPSKSSYENMHMYAEQREGYPVATPDAHRPKNSTHSVAAARLAYDVKHNAPWHWPVSLYTWTKSIAAGVSLMFAILMSAGQHLDSAYNIANSVIGGAFMGITGLLLIYDLEHPTRFLRIFMRPQWKSWLVRGSFIIAGYSVVLLVQFILGLVGVTSANLAVSMAGLLFGAFTAMYTAFLFAQAKGRDLWQNPTLPLHLLSQATVCGAAVYVIVNLFLPLPQEASHVVHITLITALTVHLALVVSELVIPHTIVDAKQAAYHMVYGAFKRYYWSGLIVGGIVPFILSWFTGNATLPVVASILAVAGLYLYEHAYVQAGQSVPLS